MYFVRTLEGQTLTLDTEQAGCVLDVKKHLAALEGYRVDDQRILCEGRQLGDDEQVEEESTLYISLRLLGGGKKRKKKVYTTPKKNKHKKKKVKLSVLRFYEVEENGKIRRLRRECTAPTCGGGVFMAAHSNRYYCGKCHDTLVVQEPAAGSSGAKGGKAAGKKK